MPITPTCPPPSVPWATTISAPASTALWASETVEAMWHTFTAGFMSAPKYSLEIGLRESPSRRENSGRCCQDTRDSIIVGHE